MAYDVELKPFSRAILHYLSQDGETVTELSLRIGVKSNKINAVITKSLVRYGFAIRYSKLSKVLKKEKILVAKTPTGIEWEKRHPITDEEAQEMLAEHKAVYIIPNENDENYLLTLEDAFDFAGLPPEKFIGAYDFINNFGEIEDGKFIPNKFSDITKQNQEGEIWHYLFLNLLWNFKNIIK